MLAKAFRIVRTDLTWSQVEVGGSCGQYNFSHYDTLLATMEAHQLQPYWTLGYGNGACYPNPVKGGDPRECTAASCLGGWARFATAVVARYKGRGIIFECDNEPNGLGRVSAAAIAPLCNAAGAAFTTAGELFVGPAPCNGGLGGNSFDWPYLNTSMRAGLLDAFGAISVHPCKLQKALSARRPYTHPHLPRASFFLSALFPACVRWCSRSDRNLEPETVLADYTRLRRLIKQHGTTPAQRAMPVLCGEWGFSSARLPAIGGVPEPVQAAKMLRAWLTNLLAGVPLSIDYDWSDDDWGLHVWPFRVAHPGVAGLDPGLSEDNFGSVSYATGDPGLPFVQKPKYRAAAFFQQAIGDYATMAGRATGCLV